MTRTRGQWPFNSALGPLASKLALFLQKAERSVRKDPQSASFAASVAAHALLFALFGYLFAMPAGTPFGNGIDADETGMSVSISYTPEALRSDTAAAPDAPVKAFNRLASTRSVTAETAKAREKAAAAKKAAEAKREKKIAAMRPEDAPAADLKVKKALDTPDISDKLFAVKAAKKTTAALDIPAEADRQLAKKLSAAMPSEGSDTGEVASGGSTATIVEKDADDTALIDTGAKMLGEDGELIASTAPLGTALSKPTADPGDGTATDATPSGGVPSSGKNASGSQGKKGGTGPYGKPGGTGRSGIAFEMVADSGYDEMPSFLNGPPEIPYPKWAQEQGVEGRVSIVLEILPNGEVGSIAKHESPISDRLAQELVRQAEMWRFKPIYKNGKALSGNVMVTVDYSLKSR